LLGAVFVVTALELAAQKPVQQLSPQEKAAAIIEFGQQYSKGARPAAVQQLRDALNTYLKMPKSGPFKNVLAKAVGSRNPINLVRATIIGLQAMTSPKRIASKRGKTVEEVLGNG
jgi:hypothetical protein